MRERELWQTRVQNLQEGIYKYVMTCRRKILKPVILLTIVKPWWNKRTLDCPQTNLNVLYELHTRLCLVVSPRMPLVIWPVHVRNRPVRNSHWIYYLNQRQKHHAHSISHKGGFSWAKLFKERDYMKKGLNIVLIWIAITILFPWLYTKCRQTC